MYGGMSASNLKRLKVLEAKNAKLKKMYSGLALETDAIRGARKPASGTLPSIDSTEPNFTF